MPSSPSNFISAYSISIARASAFPCSPPGTRRPFSAELMILMQYYVATALCSALAPVIFATAVAMLASTCLPSSMRERKMIATSTAKSPV